MDPEQGPQDQSLQEGAEPGSAQQPFQYPPPPQYSQQYSPPPPQYPPQRPQRHDEKHDEKQGEKEQEKKQEKGQGLDEKYRRNPLGFVSFALLVIWLGVSLLLQNAGVIEDGNHGWAIFFWGGGVIILVLAIFQLLIPRFRRPVVGSFVWGAIWLGIGFGLWYDKWEVIGPLVIIAIGVAILVGRLVPRR